MPMTTTEVAETWREWQVESHGLPRKNGASTVTKFHDKMPLAIEAPLIVIHRGTSVAIDTDY